MSTGLDAQIGIGEEVTWGTGVTPTRFYPFTSESIQNNLPTIESDSIRAGQRLQNEADYTRGVQRVDGDIELEMRTKGMAFLYKHMLGAIATAGAGPYTHTVTPGTLLGKGLTIQVGRPSTDGTVNPFTYAGCKIASWEIACAIDEFASLTLTVAGKSETTATGLAPASYTAAADLLAFTHGALTIAGSAVPVTALTLTGDNGLNLERYFFGDTARNQPLEGASRRTITGTLEAEFDSLTQYQRFTNGTNAALVFTLARGTSSIVHTLNVRFDGETPTVDGTDIISQSIPFKAVTTSALTDASAFTAVITSSEATP